MVNVPVWMLMVYVGSTVATISFIIWQSRQLRKLTRLAGVLSGHLHDCTGVVEAISARGNLICDACHQPIAPRTPTTIEEHEGAWTIAHDTCP